MKVTIRISPKYVAVQACLGLTALASLTTLGAVQRGTIRARGLCDACLAGRAPSIEERIVKTALEKNIEPLFPLRIAWRESRYRPTAVGRDSNGQHDWGVFQLSDHAVRVLHVKDPLDPQQNISAAVGLLAHYLKLCGSQRAAAYAYARGRCPAALPRKRLFAQRALPSL